MEPLHIAMWGIPTAIAAFIIHAWRLRRLDQTLARELGGAAEADVPATAVPAKEGR